MQRSRALHDRDGASEARVKHPCAAMDARSGPTYLCSLLIRGGAPQGGREDDGGGRIRNSPLHTLSRGAKEPAGACDHEKGRYTEVLRSGGEVRDRGAAFDFESRRKERDATA